MVQVLTARNAVMLSFFLNGLAFSTWVSRIPEVRDALGLDNAQLGLLLLGVSIGSVLTLPTTGALIDRWSAATVVRAGVLVAAAGLALTSVGAGTLGSVPLAAVGLVLYGSGVGSWDVAMNVEGGSVERRLGRTIMPRFHAGFSLGTVAGGILGAAATALAISLPVHFGAIVALGVVLTLATIGGFLPVEARVSGGRSAFAAWLEPRTLLIGLMVFALAVTEGTANDWLAVALIDGYDVRRWVGVAGFACFVAAMTLGRVVGPPFLDRHGRTAVLWGTMAAAGVGVLLVVYGGHPALVLAGIMLWGVGASLGFPVGMSAAADDPEHAAVRVSVVSTIAYTAFLSGPPFLGFLADRVGALHALLAVAVLLVPSALVVPSARAARAD